MNVDLIVMSEATTKKPLAEAFPSTRFLVKTYTAGAILAILLSFSLPLDNTQTVVSLAIGWMLTSVALGLSVFLDNAAIDEMDEEQDYF